jgi:hypothetical protein
MNFTEKEPLAFFEYILIENNISIEIDAQLKYYDFQSYRINLPYIIKYVEYDEWNNIATGEFELQKILSPILRREFEKSKRQLYSTFLSNDSSINLNFLTYQFNTIQSLISNNLNIIKRYPYILLPLRGIVKFINDQLLIPGNTKFTLDENDIEFKIDSSLIEYEKTIEQLVHSIFDFMKGKNERKEIILSEDDFNILIEYTIHLVEKECVPEIHKKLEPNLSSKGLILISYWVLHKELYKTSKIKPYFYHFIKEVFENFRNSEISSIKSQFGTKSRVFNHEFISEIIRNYLLRD